MQWQAYLGAGSLLLSDMGRVLMSIAADTSGTPRRALRRVERAAQRGEVRDGGVHGAHPNARDRFAVALAKHGLDRRDIAPCVNFFKGVRVERRRRAQLRRRRRRPGAVVELRAEMPVLVVVANTPHVLDPRPDYIGDRAAHHRVDRPADGARRPAVVGDARRRARVPATPRSSCDVAAGGSA